jgi:hypothetical protein
VVMFPIPGWPAERRTLGGEPSLRYHPVYHKCPRRVKCEALGDFGGLDAWLARSTSFMV